MSTFNNTERQEGRRAAPDTEPAPGRTLGHSTNELTSSLVTREGSLVTREGRHRAVGHHSQLDYTTSQQLGRLSYCRFFIFPPFWVTTDF